MCFRTVIKIKMTDSVYLQPDHTILFLNLNLLNVIVEV
jgi:hypothetical protein